MLFLVCGVLDLMDGSFDFPKFLMIEILHEFKNVLTAFN